MFFDYFIDFYMKFQLSYSMPVTEGILILSAIVLLNKYEKTPHCFLRIGAHFVLWWAAVILFKCLVYGNGFNMTFVPAIFLVAYAAFFGNLKLRHRALYCMYFLIIQVFSTSFAKSCGAAVCTLANCVYEEWMASLSLTLVKALLFGGFTALMKLLPLEKYDNIAKYYYVFAAFVVVVAYIAKIIVDNIKDFTSGILNPTETEYALFIFFVGLLLYLLTALAYYSCYYQTVKQYKNETLEGEIGLIRQNYESQRDVYDLSKDNLDEMRRIRHDIKNQFTYMQLILEQNKYEELRQYFNELNENVALPLSYSDCENRIVRDVLNMEINKLRGNVKIDYKLAIGTRLAIENLDLTTLLINLLDNAVEACDRDNPDNAVIAFYMLEKDGYLYVTVENPVADTDIARRLFSQGTGKKDKSGHGYGTKIIAAIVEKHKGIIKYSIENNKFRADVMIALNGE